MPPQDPDYKSHRQAIKNDIKQLKSTLEQVKGLEVLRDERDRLFDEVTPRGKAYTKEGVCPYCLSAVKVILDKGSEKDEKFHCPHERRVRFAGDLFLQKSEEVERSLPIEKQRNLLDADIKRFKLEKLNIKRRRMQEEIQAVGHVYEVKGHCPYCHVNVTVMAKKGLEDSQTFYCPSDRSHVFTVNKAREVIAKLPTQHIVKPESIIKSGSSANLEFLRMLRSFKIYTILSIFFDSLLFIFTILGFLEKNRLDKIEREYYEELSPESISSFRNWRTAFLVIFWIQVILIVLGIIVAVDA